jgi:hypothetical protein
MDVVLRAWITGGQEAPLRRLITGWLTNPEAYRGQRKELYRRLVDDFRLTYVDPRPEWRFYADGVFSFHTSGHRQAWDFLADLDSLARLVGRRGLIVLFDEFENAIVSLNRRDLQQAAFYNLFDFFSGTRFTGRSYFAVTPDFVQRCKSELLHRGVYDFDYRAFEMLPTFELEPLDDTDFCELARRIRMCHALAYEWNASDAMPDHELRRFCSNVWVGNPPDKVRRGITAVVATLDVLLTEAVPH